MYFTFKKNNKQTKKPVNRFLQDGASAGIRSLQTTIEIKLSQSPWNGLQKTNHSIILKTRINKLQAMFACDNFSLELLTERGDQFFDSISGRRKV